MVALSQPNEAGSTAIGVQGRDWDWLADGELRQHAPPRDTPLLVISKIVGQISTRPRGQDTVQGGTDAVDDGPARKSGIIAETIRLTLSNLPAILFVAAVAAAALRSRRARPWAEIWLSWLLLLPIGVAGVWAGLFHVFFPRVAASFIGWEVSPFQFEVGMADLAIGVTACVAFWQALPFKAACVSIASVFLLGDAAGHVHQMLEAGNFAPGNAGVPFYMDVICPLLAISLLGAAYRGRGRA